MRRNAKHQQRHRLSLIFLIGLIVCAPYTVFAQENQRSKNVIIKVDGSANLQSLAARYGLRSKKTVNRGAGGYLVIDGQGRDAAALKNLLKNETSVVLVEDDVLIPLDNGETVLPLDNGETVLPLGATIMPLDNGETVLPLDNGETVLPLDNGETVLPLEVYLKIKAYYDRVSQILTPSKLLLIQSPLLKIGLYEAGSRVTGRGVIVADLDTGADSCHPVLRGVFQVSFVEETTIPENCPLSTTTKVPGYGHGTAVGSLIRTVAPEATLWSLRVFDSTGTAQVSDVAEAIVYATDRGAKVINMSFGMTQVSETLREALQYAYDRGVILVAAGGNSGVEGLMYPAAFSTTKGIVAVNNKDVKASFSNYARGTAVSAPGVNIRVAYPGSMISVASGTSFAAPLTAGEAALILDALSRLKNGTPARWQTDLPFHFGVQWIDDLNPKYQGKLGTGRIYIPYALYLTGIYNN